MVAARRIDGCQIRMSETQASRHLEPGPDKSLFHGFANKGQPCLSVRLPAFVRFSIHFHSCIKVHACMHTFYTYFYVRYVKCCKQSEPVGRRHTHQTDRDQSACFGCHTNSRSCLPPSILPACLPDCTCMHAGCTCLQQTNRFVAYGMRGLDRFFDGSWRVVWAATHCYPGLGSFPS